MCSYFIHQYVIFPPTEGKNAIPSMVNRCRGRRRGPSVQVPVCRSPVCMTRTRVYSWSRIPSKTMKMASRDGVKRLVWHPGDFIPKGLVIITWSWSVITRCCIQHCNDLHSPDFEVTAVRCGLLWLQSLGHESHYSAYASPSEVSQIVKKMVKRDHVITKQDFIIFSTIMKYLIEIESLSVSQTVVWTMQYTSGPSLT